MKQTRKLRADDNCRISFRGTVLSIEWASRKSGLSRSTGIILRQRSMNQNENNLYPGPLTVSGFKWGSHCEVNLPFTGRTPVKTAAKDQNRIKSISGIGFPVFLHPAEGDVKPGKHKHTLKTHAENRYFLNYEIILYGVPDCVDATAFRQQNNLLGVYPKKMCDILPNASIRSFTQFDEVACIYRGKSNQVQLRGYKNAFWNNEKKLDDMQKPVKNSFRWRKSMNLIWLVELSNRWKNRDDCGIELYSRYSNN